MRENVHYFPERSVLLFPLVHCARTHRTGHARDRDAGVLLLDVLIGIALAALVLVTASQTIGTLRERAYELVAMDNARQVGEKTMVEGLTKAEIAAMRGAGPGSSALPAGTNLNQRMVVGDAFTPTDNDPFAVCVEHRVNGVPNAYAVYDSGQGALSDHGRGTGCPELTPAIPPPPGWTASTSSVPCPIVTPELVSARRGTGTVNRHNWYIKAHFANMPAGGIFRWQINGGPSYWEGASGNKTDLGGDTWEARGSAPADGTTQVVQFIYEVGGVKSEGCTQLHTFTIPTPFAQGQVIYPSPV